MSAGFTSHASNFTGSLQTGADPRTGQFFINSVLVEVRSHRLLGPLLHLSLSYSSFSDVNFFGLGKGVSLGGISWFDQKSHRIVLSNGESWEATGAGEIRNRRLKDCVFKHNGTGDKTIRWKNGTTEILGRVGTDHYLTKQIIAPSGRSIHFEWVWNGRSALLRTVRDSDRVTICECDYKGLARHNRLIAGTAVTITVWPHTSESYQTGLGFQNDYLSRLVRQGTDNDSDKEIWLVKFSQIGGRYLPVELQHPTGLRDIVTYNATALKFPAGGSGVPFPAVNRHVRKYGRGQTDTVRDYTYTPENFLGYGARSAIFGQWNASKDYLYRRLARDYEYGSTETVHLDGKKLTIKRKYNNYHFLVSEEEVQGQSTLLKETGYHAKYDVDVDSQPFNYALPHTQTVTYKRAGQLPRAEQVRTTHDDYGNPLSVHRQDGTVETYVWYAAGGEAGACPAEPGGFVRFLKQKTTVPPTVNGYALPRRVEHYTYEALGGTGCIVEKRCTGYSEFADKKTQLYSRETSYVADRTSPDFGRVLSIVSTLYDLSDSGKRYVTTQSFTTSVDAHGNMRQAVTHRSHDGQETTYRTEKSVYTELVLRETDIQGVTTTCRYDSLGRIVEQVHADGTPYRTHMTWTYSVERSDDMIIGPVTVHEDARGRKSRIYCDGAGRAVCHDLYDLDLSGSWLRVAECRYDALGRLIWEKHSDWAHQDRKTRAGPASFTTEAIFGYDEWGNRNLRIEPDGTKNHEVTDPVGLTRTVFQESADGSWCTGRQVTTLDKSLYKPVKVESYTATSTLDSIQTYTWDGLGRMRESADAMNNVTKWSYDMYGRVDEQTLPDGTKVRKTYAGHLTGEQATAVYVHSSTPGAEHLVGTQKFDYLGRLTETGVGGRKTGFVYEHAHSPLPERVTLPSGGILQYSYIAELGNAKKSMAGGHAADSAHVKQGFEYDAATRQLTAAVEGDYRIGFGYTRSGALQSETFTNASRPANNATSTYGWTFGGLAETHNAVNGGTRSYKRDRLGRVIQIDDPALSVTLLYDGLGRICERKVTTRESSPRMAITTFDYDDFNREKTRTLSDGLGGKTISLSQTWHKNGLLASRKLLQGAIILTAEAFGYDRRNRLVDYTVTGARPGSASYGNLSLSHQTYEYDILNNLAKVVTTHTDKSLDTATYDYSEADPTQLIAVYHTHTAYPKQIDLKYDAEGRMILDEAGRVLGYDVTGRLASVKDAHGVSGTYEYDALNRLVRQTRNDGESWLLYYMANELVHELAANDGNRRFIKTGHTCLAIEHQPRGRAKAAITLIGNNQNNSPVWTEETGKAGQIHAWAPYGHGETEERMPGFNGERIDPVSRTYHLGNGYRAYNPVLMRFNAPDSMSPFGAGGINPYAYCAGDPINHTDPSGHIGTGQTIGLGLGILFAMGGLMAIITGGSSIAAASAIASALSSVADVTGVGGLVGAGLEAAADGLSAAEAIEAVATVSARTSVTAISDTLTSSKQRLVFPKKTWGWGTTNNIHTIAVGARGVGASRNDRYLYMFQDLHQGERRLNVVGHASFEPSFGSATFLTAEGRHLTGVNIGRLARERYNVSDFACARIIMCHSAEGGFNSLASQFGASTGLITTGFIGEVSTMGEMAHEASEIFKKVRMDLVGADRLFLENRDQFFGWVRSGLITNPNDPGDAYFRIISEVGNYKPVTFQNRCLISEEEYGGTSLY